MNKDLTQGKSFPLVWLYTLPLLGSILFQQLYNIADSFVAGKFLGENALAAVGNGSEVTLIYTAFALGSNIGCSVVISRLFGAKDHNKLKTCIYTSFISFGILCLILMAFGFIFTKPLLKWMQTPSAIFEDSFVYLMWYTAGIPFVFFYNVATGIFSAMGDSKTPFIFLAFSSTANILVDILFVTQTSLGVAGVAIATLICQGVSCILSLAFLLLRLRKIKTEGKIALFDRELFGKICKVAIPSILQQGSISVGNIIIQGIVNGYGEETIAGFTAAIKLNNIATSCYTAIANGLSAYTSQNMGANKLERIKKGLLASLSISFAVSIVLFGAYFFASKECIELFLDHPSDNAILSGITFLRIVSPFYFAVCIKITVDGVLRGSGAMHLFMISTMIDLVLRVILAFILPLRFDFLGIALSWPIGWIVATILTTSFYFAGKWKKAKL